MKSKTEIQTSSKLDWFKWGFVLFLIIAGLFANYYYNTQPWPLRLLGWLLLLVVASVIALQTMQGKKLLEFGRESRTELRKVYWPTRQETVQTTLVVAVIVVVLGLVLWGVDSILMWLVGWLTGQRG